MLCPNRPKPKVKLKRILMISFEKGKKHQAVIYVFKNITVIIVIFM